MRPPRPPGPGLLQEVDQEPVHLGRPLQVRHVGDAGDDDPPRPRDAPLEEPVDAVDVLAVQLALDDEDRRRDLAQPPDRRRLELTALRVRQRVRHRHLERLRPDGRIDLRGRAVRPGQPRAQEQVGHPRGVALRAR